MRYTPVELRHVRVGRALLGYKRDETDRVLDDVADSFEEVWRDRGELTDKLEEVAKSLFEPARQQYAGKLEEMKKVLTPEQVQAITKR